MAYSPNCGIYQSCSSYFNVAMYNAPYDSLSGLNIYITNKWTINTTNGYNRYTIDSAIPLKKGYFFLLNEYYLFSNASTKIMRGLVAYDKSGVNIYSDYYTSFKDFSNFYGNGPVTSIPNQPIYLCLFNRYYLNPITDSYYNYIYKINFSHQYSACGFYNLTATVQGLTFFRPNLIYVHDRKIK